MGHPVCLEIFIICLKFVKLLTPIKQGTKMHFFSVSQIHFQFKQNIVSNIRFCSYKCIDRNIKLKYIYSQTEKH